MEHKDAMLEAIDQLIEHYNRFKSDEIPERLKSCPLCDFDDRHSEYGIGDCNKCPWVLFEYSTVIRYINPCVSHNFILQTTSQRLERLERWKTLINAGATDHE